MGGYRMPGLGIKRINPVVLTALCLVFYLLCIPRVSAQRYEWHHQYGDDITLDRIHALATIASGEYYAVGWSKSKSSLVSKVFLLKIDADGDTVWTRRFGIEDSLDTHGRDIVSTSDGGCVIAGEVYRSAARGNELFLMKITPDGAVSWTGMYGSEVSEYARAVVATRDGGFAMVGYTFAGLDTENMLLMKADSLGDSLWSSIHSRTYPCRGHALVETIDGGLAVAGYSGSWRAPEKTNMLLVAYDGQGRERWASTYGGEWYEEANAVCQTADQGFVLAGYTTSFDVEGRDFLIVETDSAGKFEDLKTYGGAADDFAHAVMVDDHGARYVVGYSNSFGEAGYYYDNYNPYIIYTDDNGESLWAVALGNHDADDYVSDAILSADGWPVIAGYTLNLVDEQDEYGFIAKIGPNAAPIFENLPDTVNIIEDDDWELHISVADADADTVALTCLLPGDVGIDFIDYENNTALLTFAPTYQNVGMVYPCIVIADDEYLIARDTVWLAVINRPLQATVYQPGMYDDILITDSPIPIYFNETIDAASLPENVTVFSTRGDSLTYDYDAQLNILQVVARNESFLPLDTIIITLGSGIVDLAGYSLGPPITAEIVVGPVVYPGDTDYNGMVDERDILPLGRFWQRSGPERSVSDDIGWDMIPAHRWDDLAATHADANGDGSVNADDICAVTENWLRSWNDNDPGRVGSNTPALFRQLDQSVLEQIYTATQTCANSKGREAIARLLVNLIGQRADLFPIDFELYQNYPNPFNPETVIKYYVPSSGEITVSVYNIIGQRVLNLVDGFVEQGYGTVEWHGTDQSGNPVASGIYFYRLETEETSLTRRMILIR